MALNLRKRKRSLPNWRTWLPRHIHWSLPSTRSHRRAADSAAQEGPSEQGFLKVAKNTWCPALSRARTTSAFKDALKGPLLYAFSKEDPGAAGRLIKDFAKANER